MQEIKLRRDNLVERICHPLNIAQSIESIKEDSVLNEIHRRRDNQNDTNVTDFKQ